jgi:monofunctional biosynthetic peptidoglycan transglycosylase
VDFKELEQAIRDAMAGKSLRGASTLTQQTAKNLFLWPGRDWTRKGLELPLALLLEQVWGKRRTLEVYLNIVEFAPGVYGVGAASEYWFGKPVQRLSRDEAARLAAILPNPWIYSAQPPSNHVRRRADWVLRQMQQLGPAWIANIK